MSKKTDGAQTSTSVQVILEQLDVLKMNKSEFAKQLGVSQDYVYRILNNRTPFPHARETIERMAQICGVDPYIFNEYRTLDEALSVSTKLVWQRMRERGMTREELFQAMGGRISRPYFNSILRGDQPFPSNRAYIQMFALALTLPPTVFREFGPKQAPRWTPEQLADMEEKTYNLFFDVMMASYGFAPHPVDVEMLDSAKILSFFAPKEAYSAALVESLTRMGTLGMGFRELEKVSGVARKRLIQLFSDGAGSKKFADDIAAVRRSLHMT